MSEEKKDKKHKKKTGEADEAVTVDYEDKYKRALADYQNLLKQAAREKEEYVKFAAERFLLSVLPIYDNLKTSLEHAGDEAQKNGWLEGIKFVIKQFKDFLSEMGVEEIRTVGEKFDHNTMEAMDSAETEDKEKDGVVSREVMGGYVMKGKVIRAARVVVYKIKNLQD